MHMYTRLQRRRGAPPPHFFFFEGAYRCIIYIYCAFSAAEAHHRRVTFFYFSEINHVGGRIHFGSMSCSMRTYADLCGRMLTLA